MTRVYVFGVIPGSCGEREGYAMPLWEEPLPDDAPEEELDAWEERNPMWGLRDDLGCYLDTDFIEFFDDYGRKDRFAYLATQLANPEDVEKIKATIGHCKEVVLIFEEAFGRFPSAAKMKGTDGLIYCGDFESAS